VEIQLTLDAHIDLPWQMLKNHDGETFFDIDKGAEYSAISTERLKKGGLDKAIFALYISDAMRYDLGTVDAYEDILREFSWLPKGHYTALEGGGVLGDDPIPRLTELKEISDIKYLTLVHNHNLEWVESATDGNIGTGLWAVGYEVIVECERLGIAVDVSHASDQTIKDVLSINTKPIIASHSGARAMLNHPRNLPENLIEEIAKTNGIICVPFAKRFVGSIDGVVRHIDHIVQIAGIDHVGIGSDLDGAAMVEGVGSAADWDCWQEPLRNLGYSQDAIDKIAGLNLQRVLNLN